MVGNLLCSPTVLVNCHLMKGSWFKVRQISSGFCIFPVFRNGRSDCFVPGCVFIYLPFSEDISSNESLLVIVCSFASKGGWEFSWNKVIILMSFSLSRKKIGLKNQNAIVRWLTVNIGRLITPISSDHSVCAERFLPLDVTPTHRQSYALVPAGLKLSELSWSLCWTWFMVSFGAPYLVQRCHSDYTDPTLLLER